MHSEHELMCLDVHTQSWSVHSPIARVFKAKPPHKPYSSYLSCWYSKQIMPQLKIQTNNYWASLHESSIYPFCLFYSNLGLVILFASVTWRSYTITSQWFMKIMPWRNFHKKKWWIWHTKRIISVQPWNELSEQKTKIHYSRL